MAARYVDDAGFLGRVPAVFATALTENQRRTALEDAQEFVSLAIVGGKSELAHAYYAAHLLLCRFPTELASVGGGVAGPVSSKRAGEIAVTYAVATPVEGSPASTPFGQKYLEVMDLVPHPPIAV